MLVVSENAYPSCWGSQAAGATPREAAPGGATHGLSHAYQPLTAVLTAAAPAAPAALMSRVAGKVPVPSG